MFGPFKKKPASIASVPSAEAEPERYAGRPLLIVLENYVLDCIGELPPDKQALACSIVQRVWGGGDDDWKATVRAQLRLEPSLDESLQGMWSRNRELAKRHDQPLHGVQFASAVVRPPAWQPVRAGRLGTAALAVRKPVGHRRAPAIEMLRRDFQLRSFAERVHETCLAAMHWTLGMSILLLLSSFPAFFLVGQKTERW